ncbi:uncharacterized protein LOC112082100 [Eutrema salsugineum]|uniref:uncharacterized protein LOC112082100 n=1 Tax=Eutrema salsugineum TaxID=72664 RepID=UPI000CECFAD3|nr:uncharacterized protein LOC112082100 [Eutrema salsugineum]
MENEQDREAGQLKRINDHVCKFVACYETALKQQSSGQNENDLMKAAHHIFYNDHMFKFTLEHAWRELRHDQKWCSVSAGKQGGKPKRRKVDATTTHSESSQTQSVDVEEGFEGSNQEKRPQGVKAAKAAKKKGVHTGHKEGEDDMKKLQTMWDLKDRDLAMKDKITNKKLLNTLLLKNDINVLERSPVFDDILQGRAPKFQYWVNGHKYKMGYYLTDGIYPKWAAFIPTIPLPQDDKASLFATTQESARKDVERAFGVIQARFAIVRNPALFWDKEKIGNIMRASIILHNMIVENEWDGYTQYNIEEFQQGESSRTSQVDNEYSTETSSNIGNLIGIRNQIRDPQIHERLKKDLVENIWNKFGNSQE